MGIGGTLMRYGWMDVMALREIHEPGEPMPNVKHFGPSGSCAPPEGNG